MSQRQREGLTPGMDGALTLGLGVVVALLLAGLGGAGVWATKAGLVGFGVIMVVGAISLLRGARVGDGDHRAAGPGADGRERAGLGGGGRRDGDDVGARTRHLGSERAWRAWLDEMEEREK